jgi:hypothetical protein
MATSYDLRNVSILFSLKLFVAGALLASITWGTSYISQSFYTTELDYRYAYDLEKNQTHNATAQRYRHLGTLFQVLSVILILLSLLLFA